jgi:hypothetical protein
MLYFRPHYALFHTAPGGGGTREISSSVVGDLDIVEVPVFLHGWEAMPSGPGSGAKLTGEDTGNSRALAA